MRLIIASLAVVFAFATSIVSASEPSAVFGQALMTTEEVADYRTKLANCTSQQERDQVKAEHKDRMVQRARWKGMVIRPEMTMAGNDEP